MKTFHAESLHAYIEIVHVQYSRVPPNLMFVSHEHPNVLISYIQVTSKHIS